MIKKIAVLRANALGDFVFVLPALQALRDSFPRAEIVLLGKSMHRELLKDRPSPVSRVEVVPPYPGVGETDDFVPDEEVVNSFFSRMQQETFDLAFQMHGGGKYSNPFVLRLGAARTIGSRTPDAAPLDRSIAYTTYFSETLRYLELVSIAGAVPRTLAPAFSVTSGDLREAAEVFCPDPGKPLVVLQPGATDPRRWWPSSRFARVGDALVSRGYQVCFNGVQSETSLVARVLQDMKYGHPGMNLAGRLTLSALVGLLALSKIVISNDTGPLHLANAIGTPSVGLYWAPNMVTGSPITAARARTLISWNTNCPDCGVPFLEKNKAISCSHTSSLVGEIEVEEVLACVDQLEENRRLFPLENEGYSDMLKIVQ